MSSVRTLSQLLEMLRQGYTVSDGSINPPLIRQAAALKPKKQGRHFCISIAHHVIEIRSRFNEIYSMSEKYLIDSEADIHISVSDSDLDYERKQEDNPNKIYNDGYLEASSILRKISEAMLSSDTFLMHGAVVVANDEAFMFTADSGTGKTTHIKKWLENLEHAYVVNGDKPLIQITDDQAIACGTPWCGKECMGTNTMVPLKAIVLMERGDSNLIEQISFSQAYIFLLQQTHRPADYKKMIKTLELVSRLDGRVKFYKFVFNNMKDDAFSVSYNCLTGTNEL